MAEPIPASTTGTSQHRRARDLSRWLVHLAQTPDDLAGILVRGTIEARNSFGIARPHRRLLTRQDTVCFTEMPVSELGRMTSRGRRWGVGFDKEFLRDRFDAQPVWYLSDPSPQLRAVQQMLDERIAAPGGGIDPSDPYWRLTPFIDPVRPRGSARPNDWRWEREWRVVGDVSFELSDAAFIVWSEGDDLLWDEQLTVGSLFVSHHGDEFWCDSPLEALDAQLGKMLDQLKERYLPVVDAGLPWDSEEHEYAPVNEILEACDVVEETFESFPVPVKDALADALVDIGGDLWCRAVDSWRLDDE